MPVDFETIAGELRRSRAENNEERARRVKEDAAHDLMSQHYTEQRDSFQNACSTVRTPIEAYAIWLITWITQGGHVRYSESDFSRSNSWLTPTRSTDMLIPVGYGAHSMHLLIPSDYVSIPHEPSTDDSREGWEWGHTTVLRLFKEDGEFRATTNNPRSVRSYPDVEQLILGMKVSELSQKMFGITAGGTNRV